MIIGTTPTFSFSLPFEATRIKSAEFVLRYTKAGEVVTLVKELKDCVLGDMSIAVTLTQEETLQMPVNDSVSVQLRVLLDNSSALATKIHEVPVFKLLKEGVII